MAAAADTPQIPPTGRRAARSRRPLLITLLVGIVVAAATGAGVWYFTQPPPIERVAGAHATAKAPPAPAQYFALEPPFVVNLNGAADGPSYLQVEVQLMTRDGSALEAIKTHSPALRARLLMLFSQVVPERIADRAGKEALQADALAEVRSVLLAETGRPCVEALLFTSFVTQ